MAKQRTQHRAAKPAPHKDEGGHARAEKLEVASSAARSELARKFALRKAAKTQPEGGHSPAAPAGKPAQPSLWKRLFARKAAAPAQAVIVPKTEAALLKAANPPQAEVSPPKAASTPPKAAPPKAEAAKSASRESFFKRLFRRKAKAKSASPEGGPAIPAAQTPAEAKAAEAVTKAAAHRDAKQEAEFAKARKLLEKKAKKHRRSEQERRRVLSSLIMKAGFSIKPEQLQKSVLYTTFVIIGAASALSIMMAVVAKKPLQLLLFTFSLWTALFALVYLFLWMVIYVYLDVRIYNRTRELEEVLPDFLQLASANISAGMPIDRALWFAVRPNFGVLAKEIEEVAKSTLAGEELNDSLIRFTERYDSPTLRRSVNILLEGMAAGGEMAELLNKIALDIQETKILRKEMGANVATYAIFITFASVVMAPILFALATELLVIIVKITSTLDLSSASSSFISLNVETSPEMISNFKWFSVMMLTISALMSASIVAVIRKGRIKEGLRNLPIFVAVSLALYYLSSLALHALLGGFI